MFVTFLGEGNLRLKNIAIRIAIHFFSIAIYRNTEISAIPSPRKSSTCASDIYCVVLCCDQKRNHLVKDMSKEMVSSAIVEGNTTIKSRRQLSQIIDTTLLKCYIQVYYFSQNISSWKRKRSRYINYRTIRSFLRPYRQMMP